MLGAQTGNEAPTIDEACANLALSWCNGHIRLARMTSALWMTSAGATDDGRLGNRGALNGGPATEAVWLLLRRHSMCQILVAEDDSEMRRLVVEVLRKEGHHVFEAEDGRALSRILAQASSSLAQTGRIDIVVSDVRMPSGNALDVFEQLEDITVRPRIILMTAFANDETRRRSRELGACLLEKPLSLDDLRAAVSAAAPPTIGSF